MKAFSAFNMNQVKEITIYQYTRFYSLCSNLRKMLFLNLLMESRHYLVHKYKNCYKLSKRAKLKHLKDKINMFLLWEEFSQDLQQKQKIQLHMKT